MGTGFKGEAGAAREPARATSPMQKEAGIAADPHCLDLDRSTRTANGADFAFRSPGSGAILLQVSAPATLVASAAFGLPRPLCLGPAPVKPLSP
ncbi:hypothetical protein HMP06_3294 [Sphingomonas sp. HMP6]|nr:hypothetical protein HMP06_3294 [Sphingomonas sp. HMP6]